MQTGLIHLHNFSRWAVIICGILALVRYGMGYFQKKTFADADRKAGLFYLISCDLQLLIGILLFFFGSAVPAAMEKGMAVAMKDPILRFFSVEHSLMMLIAIALVHVGYSKSKKGEDSSRFRMGLIFYSLSFLIIMAMIPWPFRAEIGRALFPGM